MSDPLFEGFKTGFDTVYGVRRRLLEDRRRDAAFKVIQAEHGDAAGDPNLYAAMGAEARAREDQGIQRNTAALKAAEAERAVAAEANERLRRASLNVLGAYRQAVGRGIAPADAFSRIEPLLPQLGVTPEQMGPLRERLVADPDATDELLALLQEPQAKPQQRFIQTQGGLYDTHLEAIVDGTDYSPTRRALDERRLAVQAARAEVLNAASAASREAAQRRLALEERRLALAEEKATKAGGGAGDAGQRGRALFGGPSARAATDELLALTENGTVNPIANPQGVAASVSELVPFDNGAVAQVVGDDQFDLFANSFNTVESSLLPIFAGSAATQAEAQRFLRANRVTPGDGPPIVRAKMQNVQRLVNAAARVSGEPLPYPEVGLWKPPAPTQQRGPAQQSPRQSPQSQDAPRRLRFNPATGRLE